MGYQEEASAGKPQPVYCAQHIDNHAHILHGYFAAMARGDGESDRVTISVRLGEAGDAVKLEFSRQEDASVIEDAIRKRLRLSSGAYFELIKKDGTAVGISGKLLAGEYVVEVIN
jgi:hypothetical protein